MKINQTTSEDGKPTFLVIVENRQTNRHTFEKMKSLLVLSLFLCFYVGKLLRIVSLS